jgi:hypothetical protein
MATLKIYQSEVAPQSNPTPNVTNLQLPLSLATEMASGTGKLGKVITDIFKEQKDKEDNNTFFKIVTETSPDISTIATESSRLTNVKEGIDYFTNTIKEKNFLDKYPDINSNVKNKYNDWLTKQQLQLIPSITSSISKNSIEVTQITNEQILNNANLKRASNNPADRIVGDAEFNSFFKNPVNLKTYGPDELNKLRLAKENQALEFKLIYDTKNNPLDVLNNKEQIISLFGKQKADIYLNDARQAFVSKKEDELRLAKNRDAIDLSQQISTFAELAVRINNFNLDNSNEKFVRDLPSLDYINDLAKNNNINSAQFDTLLDVYKGTQKLSDNDILDLISAQISVAKNVNEIDLIRSTVNLNPNIIKKLNIQDVEKFNKIFESHKEKREGYQQDGYYRNLLKIQNGEIKNFISMKVGDAEIRQNLNAFNATQTYNEYLSQGLTPEKSYLKTLETIDTKHIPNLKLLRAPENVKISPTLFSKDKKQELKDVRIELLQKYKENKINITQFKEDLSRIDVIDQVYDLREKLNLPDQTLNTSQQGTINRQPGTNAPIKP